MHFRTLLCKKCNGPNCGEPRSSRPRPLLPFDQSCKIAFEDQLWAVWRLIAFSDGFVPENNVLEILPFVYAKDQWCRQQKWEYSLVQLNKFRDKHNSRCQSKKFCLCGAANHMIYVEAGTYNGILDESLGLINSGAWLLFQWWRFGP